MVTIHQIRNMAITTSTEIIINSHLMDNILPTGNTHRRAIIHHNILMDSILRREILHKETFLHRDSSLLRADITTIIIHHKIRTNHNKL